ncbi:MAG: hypothetical protein QW416_08025 [Candidatus Nitrosocaldaceae archaeon]
MARESRIDEVIKSYVLTAKLLDELHILDILAFLAKNHPKELQTALAELMKKVKGEVTV